MNRAHEQLAPPPRPVEKRWFRWRFRPREKRMFVLLLVVLALAAWKLVPRPWHPTLTFKTPHHTIFSTATRPQTESTASAMEALYSSYSNNFAGLPGFQRDHPFLKVKLYKDRDELRAINPGMGWAEAFYSKPYCRAYYSASEPNPFHWMLHESVHQLNTEVAHLSLAKWLEEGLADYYATSQLQSNHLALGRIDPHTYPVWWMDILATSSDLAENLRNGSVIPLRAIITNRGGPSMRGHFNLYYLHWWTLTHFIFETPRYRNGALELAKAGGGLADFERLIGPVDRVQNEWHSHVRQLKEEVARSEKDRAQSTGCPEHDSGG